jgi:hypothetical protein
MPTAAADVTFAALLHLPLSLLCQVYHVFELEIELPKYAMYAAEERALAAAPPASHVSFVLQHPAARIASWIESRFNTKPSLGNGATGLEAAFTCMRSRQPLVVRATAGSAGLRVWLHCESMELAGELLQVRRVSYNGQPHSHRGGFSSRNAGVAGVQIEATC